MDVKNKLYKNQGIHVITALFTVEQGVTKVLLIKRKNEPFLGDWVLTGGALYNNEDLEEGALRELEEKTGITGVEIKQFKAFGKVHRSPIMRMVAVGFVGIIVVVVGDGSGTIVGSVDGLGSSEKSPFEIDPSCPSITTLKLVLFS